MIKRPKPDTPAKTPPRPLTPADLESISNIVMASGGDIEKALRNVLLRGPVL